LSPCRPQAKGPTIAKSSTNRQSAAEKKTVKKTDAKPRKSVSAKEGVAASAPRAGPGRETLPVPDLKYVGLTTYDARDPDTKYPPITMLRPPDGAPNVLIVLIDDVGSARPRRSVDPARRR
jgi:hypothetical protein